MINIVDLTGKHILITGGSAGIGRAAAVQASRLGARVSLVARNEDKLKETLDMLEEFRTSAVPGGEDSGSDLKLSHKYYIYDLNETDGIADLIKNIVSESGAIDGLVHAAGIGLNRPVKLNKPDFLEDNIKIHFYAFSELIRAASARKNSNEGASYIGVSSVAAIHGNKTQGAYSAAKAAMNAVVHPYAKELAPKGIRVNTISFGMVDTDMYKGFLDSGGNNEELLREQYLGVIPVEYAGNAICYLLSDAAKYITGGSFNYDAGALS